MNDKLIKASLKEDLFEKGRYTQDEWIDIAMYKYWHLEAAKITIDEIPIGWFVAKMNELDNAFGSLSIIDFRTTKLYLTNAINNVGSEFAKAFVENVNHIIFLKYSLKIEEPELLSTLLESFIENGAWPELAEHSKVQKEHSLREFIKEEYYDQIISFLKPQRKKPQQITAAFFALSDLGYLKMNIKEINQTHLHIALKKDIAMNSDRQAINKNFILFFAAPITEHLAIQAAKRAINHHVSLLKK